MAASLKVTNNLPSLQPLFAKLRELGEHPQPLLKSIAFLGESSSRQRFSDQVGPDGQSWKPSQRVARDGGKTLTKDGHLGNSLTASADNSQAQWGSNRIYAAIHQFGGTIEIAARSQSIYFKQNASTGVVGNQFVKKGKSNFAQRVTMGAYQIDMPARPYLGLSTDDEADILDLVSHRIHDLINHAAPGGA
ncbi:phage virion morphogenesis protein [Pseudomonas sp. D47]|uniref:phage virion morphogenesis protein n=1 Tax=Pseudomonas sp. D47 TaxID=3159447 RepID=UPI00387B8B0D